MNPRKLEQMNQRLQRLLGAIIHRDADVPADVLVTVSRVEVTHNLRGAHVFLSIYPTDRADEVAEQLRGQLYELQGALNRALDGKVIPRIRFSVDYGADRAEAIEKRLRELRRGGTGDGGEPDTAHS